MDFFLNGISTLGNGLVGYVVPFLFVLTIVVFFHELGHFLVARWCRREGPDLLDRFRPGTRRLQRPPRHALEALGDPAWRLCQVLRRRKRGEHAVDRRRSRPCRPTTARSASITSRSGACGDRRRRTDCQFHPRHRHLRRLFTFSAGRATAPRVDAVQAMAAPPPRPASSPATWSPSIDGKPIDSFSEMQRIVSTNAGQHADASVIRGGETLRELAATPELQRDQGQFRQQAPNWHSWHRAQWRRARPGKPSTR